MAISEGDSQWQQRENERVLTLHLWLKHDAAHNFGAPEVGLVEKVSWMEVAAYGFVLNITLCFFWCGDPGGSRWVCIIPFSDFGLLLSPPPYPPRIMCCQVLRCPAVLLVVTYLLRLISLPVSGLA